MSKKGISLLVISVFLLGSGTIDLNNLDNYANQPVPAYITADNTGANPITDEAATLGRVLFYDKTLSANYSTSCSSCHIQEFAFGDTAVLSAGANGVTGRHSMRLVNARFSDEDRFFWDERAKDLEAQVTQPIQDHGEMGFSGTNGDPGMTDLLMRLDSLERYKTLFNLAFGDTTASVNYVKFALSQFVRSIQSFDSKFDMGRVNVAEDSIPFSNFTPNENAGKALFLTNPIFDSTGTRIAGGVGCNGCHRSPDFGMFHSSLNNGLIFASGETPGPGAVLDTVNTKSPSLRDMFNPSGQENGPFMHNGDLPDMQAVIDHYENPPPASVLGPAAAVVDNRLYPNGEAQDLNLSPLEETQIIDFLKTLSGTNLYTDERWSNPFDVNGDLTILGSVSVQEHPAQLEELLVYPNPSSTFLNLSAVSNMLDLSVFDLTGASVLLEQGATQRIDVSALNPGVYVLRIRRINGRTLSTRFVVEQH